jgi:short-subunit dehydrogenase
VRPVALVTGSSSGIGLALARVLARNGHDLVLVARDRETLQGMAAELQAMYGAKALVVAQDLSLPGAARAVWDAVERAGLAVDVLVNNAGFGVHGPFVETAAADELRMIRVQLDVLLELTKLALPGMLARRSGRLLNVASVYSFAPVVHQAVYGACKAFMYSFSEALAIELTGQGISVTVLAPGSTRTAFRARAGVNERKPGGSGASPELVAEAGYRGMMRGRRVVVPGFWNKVFVFIVGVLPRGLVSPFLRQINRKRLAGHASHA